MARNHEEGYTRITHHIYPGADALGNQRKEKTMIKITFTFCKTGEKETNIAKYVREDPGEINETVFYALYNRGVTEKEAIECASWAELATIGESYALARKDIFVEITIENCE